MIEKQFERTDIIELAVGGERLRPGQLVSDVVGLVPEAVVALRPACVGTPSGASAVASLASALVGKKPAPPFSVVVSRITGEAVTVYADPAAGAYTGQSVSSV
jgi:hypothetical protein